jgi:ATP-binding cassette subfamily B protein
MSKFPCFRQPGAMDCGPACLRMIAWYFGKHYSWKTLRELSGVTGQGASLLGISEAAEAIGFRTLAVEASPDPLELEGLVPFIAYWPREHFIVVCRMGRKRVWVADPAKGPRWYGRDDFMRRWSEGHSELGGGAIALLLEPGPAFYSREDERNISE